MKFGSVYLDALVEYGRSVARGQARLLSLENWKELFLLLSSEQQELFARRVYRILQDSDGKADGEFFDLFGDMLRSSDLLYGDDRLVDRVCRPILDSGNERGLAWIANVAESEPVLIGQHGDWAAANDFKDRVKRRLAEAAQDVPEFSDLRRIATALGIEIEASGPEAGAHSEADGAINEDGEHR